MIYKNLDYSKAVPNGKPIIDYPYVNQRDTRTVRIKQEYIQEQSSYSRTALDTVFDYRKDTSLDSLGVHSNLTNAFLVNESIPVDAGSDMVMFTRTYMTLPKARADYEPIFYTFPDRYKCGASGETATTGTVNEDTITFNATGFEVGDFVLIKLQNMGSLLYEYSVGMVSSLGVTRNNIPYYDPEDTYTVIEIRDAPVLRIGDTRLVTAKVNLTYFKLVNPDSIEINDPFKIYALGSSDELFEDYYGGYNDNIAYSVGDELNYVTLNTSPSYDQYMAMVSSKSFLIGDTVITNIAGNIWERREYTYRAL